MTDIADCEQYTGQFHNLKTLHEAETMAMTLGLTSSHQEGDGFTTVEFGGSTWPLKPVVWVSYPNKTAVFQLEHPVVCRYLYYLFIDSNTAGAGTLNIDVRYCIPNGNIISLEPEFNLINFVVSEGMPSDNNIVSTKATKVIGESHFVSFGRVDLQVQVGPSEVNLSRRGVIRMTKTSHAMSSHPYHHKVPLELSEPFTYKQIRLTAFDDQCEINPPLSVLILEADQLDLMEQDVSLSCRNIEEARSVGPHQERNLCFYDIIEYEPMAGAVRPVCWMQFNTRDEVELVIDPIFKWPRQASVVACAVGGLCRGRVLDLHLKFLHPRLITPI
jgi:hypothetical protein